MSIYEKIANIQKRCMSKSFKSSHLGDLLPIILEECYKENLMFFFTFVEDAGVLKIKDWGSNDTVNVRLHQYTSHQLPYVKEELLINAFLITPEIKKVASSAKKEESIKESDNVPPRPIRDAEEHIRKRGVPISKKAIENYLLRYNPLKDMDPETKKSVLEYLKGMKK